eukprot:1159926-Pelagomonas_calceolata.AAC.3
MREKHSYRKGKRTGSTGSSLQWVKVDEAELKVVMRLLKQLVKLLCLVTSSEPAAFLSVMGRFAWYDTSSHCGSMSRAWPRTLYFMTSSEPAALWSVMGRLACHLNQLRFGRSWGGLPGMAPVHTAALRAVHDRKLATS